MLYPSTLHELDRRRRELQCQSERHRTVRALRTTDVRRGSRSRIARLLRTDGAWR